jgi:hypothetical protein
VPGRTTGEAVEAYTDPIRQTLRCITNGIIAYGGGIYLSGKVNTLTFVNEPVAALNGTDLGLFFSQRYNFYQEPGGDQLWRVRTRGYFYTVSDCRTEHPSEIFSYQWHPHSEVTIPHVHFKKGEERIRRVHLPTGRVSIESVAEFLIRDMGVRPGRPDWEKVINRNRELFEKNRSWH